MSLMTTLISFGAPPNLVAAMNAAADREFCTLSTIAQAVAAREMREQGLLNES
jgi:hypothetical protein